MDRFDFFTRDESCIFYECGYSCDNAVLLKLGSDRHFITDARYVIEAQQLCLKDRNVSIYQSSSLLDTAVSILTKSGVGSIVYDPIKTTARDFLALKSFVDLKPLDGFTHFMREIKSKTEIEFIRQSQLRNFRAYDRMAEFVSSYGVGKSEVELWYNMKLFLEEGGLYPTSFDPIVCINENAAKPHGLPQKDKFLGGFDTLLVDAGLKYERYCSDCTRTAVAKEGLIDFGKDQKFKLERHQKIYDVVRKAQEETISKIRVGMLAKDVDAIARGIIDNAGYGRYFCHGTGHGIGLDIHESPFISSRSERVIKDGMVFSIEPGIYIEGDIGVRIEDLVVVENGRASVLC